ncbi:MAG: DegT/DnrJ/EryC1/StrS family aminotransferase, partial [Bacteroidaceae bacterium]|nr:DegT/DnrJ/EryC1/StrS family aminotransferase [Bacteroidaceae bacterium]
MKNLLVLLGPTGVGKTELSLQLFFTNKNLSVGEGGMVVTKSDEILERLRGLRSHGMTVPSFDRFKGRAITYDVAM